MEHSATVQDSPIIAVVDDDPSIREALDDLLQSLGYRSLLFVSAEDFLNRKPSDSIDCIVIDVRMPGLSGLELQDRLNLDGARPPTLFMTSDSDPVTRAKAFAGGAHDVLGKPVDDDVLVRCLDSALASGRSRD